MTEKNKKAIQFLRNRIAQTVGEKTITLPRGTSAITVSHVMSLL